MHLLADESDSTSWIWIMSFVLIVMVGLLFVLVWWFRSRLSPDEDFHGDGFSLADLRQLHKSGKMTTEEFEKAKAQVLAGLQKPAARAENPSKNEPRPPMGS